MLTLALALAMSFGGQDKYDWSAFGPTELVTFEGERYKITRRAEYALIVSSQFGLINPERIFRRIRAIEHHTGCRVIRDTPTVANDLAVELECDSPPSVDVIQLPKSGD